MRKPYANTPAHFRSSLPVLRAVPRSLPCPEIKALLAAVGIVTVAACLPVPSRAATPAPASKKAAGPARIDLTKVQPKSLLPKRAEHQEYVVEINKLGQVARVRSEHGNGDPTFNAQTYGNALQAFIRTPDGHVILGTYRLSYDFDPKTSRVRRDVTLVRQGGVNPDAQGAALDLLSKAHEHTPPPSAANPAAAIDPRALPDLDRVSAPTPKPSPH